MMGLGEETGIPVLVPPLVLQCHLFGEERDCGFPLLGDLQMPPGRGPGQPALGVPAWPPDVPVSLGHSVILGSGERAG